MGAPFFHCLAFPWMSCGSVRTLRLENILYFAEERGAVFLSDGRLRQAPIAFSVSIPILPPWRAGKVQGVRTSDIFG